MVSMIINQKLPSLIFLKKSAQVPREYYNMSHQVPSTAHLQWRRTSDMG